LFPQPFHHSNQLLARHRGTEAATAEELVGVNFDCSPSAFGFLRG
jgi:hypothetical protein